MKKLFYSILTLAAAFTFTSCEDVPMPYDMPVAGGADNVLPEGVVLDQSFATSLGDFKSISESGSLTWKIDYSSACITGYQDFDGDGTKENQAGVTYLVGPEMDLAELADAHLTINHAMRYERGDVNTNNAVLISKDYAGDVSAATWTAIPYNTDGLNGSSFEFVDCQANIPEAYVGGKAVIAFRHTCNASASSTWEIKSIKVEKGAVEDNPVTPPAGGEGGGTLDEPYDVPAAIAKGEQTAAAVRGFIVGYVEGQVLAEGARFSATGEVSNTNILLAEAADEKDYTKCLPVQLPAGTVRDGLSLQQHPDNLGKEVLLYGDITKYFGVPGFKNTSYAKMGETEFGKNPNGGTTPPAEVKHVTIAEFLELADTENAYELTGVVKNIANTLYGNFDLVEDGASIFIYGLLDLAGQAQKFESLGIAEGDEITLVGTYVLYTDKSGVTKPEIKNAQFVKINKKGDGNDEPDDPNTNPDVNPGENLIENGDFEAWDGNTPINWKTASTAGNATLSQSTDAHGGQYAVKVGFNTTQNKRLGYKEMTLPAGTYVYSFYAKSTTADASQCQAGYVPVVDGAAVSTGYKYLGYVSLNNNYWTLVSGEFTLSAETTVCLLVMNPKSSSYATAQEILVDDATLVKK